MSFAKTNRSKKSGPPDHTPRVAAMDLLARREHSKVELLQKLERAVARRESRLRKRAEAIDEVPADYRREIEAAIDTLAEEGLQSDERFAMSFTRERLYRGHGPRRIRADLQRRGVVEALVDAAVRNVPDEENTSWRAQAARVLAKRFGDAPADDFPERARRLRYLEQRGFTGGDLPDDLFDV